MKYTIVQLIVLILFIGNLIAELNAVPWIPVSIAISAISSGIGNYLFKCRFYECCNDRTAKTQWINYDYSHIRNLAVDLNENVYGQPLANKLITNILFTHLNNEKPVKALVLSFHGWSGNGKNYVSEMIAKHLYRNGVSSAFVHKILGTAKYPNKQRADEYKEELQNFVKKEVAKCERQLFIIDEIDKIPIGVLDGLHPFLEHNAIIDGVDFRKAIFIFLSNTAGYEINNVVYKFHKALKDRSEIELKDIEKQTTLGAFNEVDGGLKDSHLIVKNVIDYFIPFFPLERKHVELCIRHFIKQTFNQTEVKQIFVNKIINELDFFPENEKLFSVSGCKKVASKVHLYLNELER